MGQTRIARIGIDFKIVPMATILRLSTSLDPWARLQTHLARRLARANARLIRPCDPKPRRGHMVRNELQKLGRDHRMFSRN